MHSEIGRPAWQRGRRAAARCWHVLFVLSLVVVPTPPGGLGATEVAEAPGPVATLLAIEVGPGDDGYTLVCQGPIQHHLLQTDGGLRVTLELPRVANAVTPDRVPIPAGLVKGITVTGDGPLSTRVEFSLREPALAVVTPDDRGLRLRLGAESSDEEAMITDEVPVGVEDLLEINVFEIPELNRTVRVSTRGAISLPLVGEMMVSGLTTTELETRLRDELSKRYLQDPQVSVFVREHGSRQVSVLGAVGKPGVYEMLGPRTLLQVLSQAGGLAKEAGADLFVIRDPADGSSERLTVSIANLMSSRDGASNIPIRPGDIITVPIDREVYVYIDGAVKTPGRIEQLGSRPITLLQAIAKAGGTTDRANLKAIQILRQGDSSTQTVLQVNLKHLRNGKDSDPVLQDGDIVVVPESFF